MNLPTSLRILKNIFTTYAYVNNKSNTTNINNKLSVVTKNINSEHKQNLSEKRTLNVIIFNICEYYFILFSLKCQKGPHENSLDSHKLHENELNTIYLVGVYKNCKTRPTIVKLHNQMSRKRLINLKNLKSMHNEKEINIYINTDETKSELETFKHLREELKQKRREADKKNLKIMYVIRENKIVERTSQPLRFITHDLWV